MKPQPDDLQNRSALREIASRAFSRTAGAPLIPGNHVRILRNAQENYPEWLEAIARAQQHVHFESYIIHDDDTGHEFADELITKAREGVRVRLIYDWMGAVGKTSPRFWTRLRSGGVEVRCYNPPRFDSPFGWLSRDHRKMIAVDGRVAFITGLCVGRMWVGNPGKRLDPWRDTGVEVRGPAVSQIEEAFAQIWALMGEPIPNPELPAGVSRVAGDMDMRVVASLPATAGMIRSDELVAALARNTLWLTDAYYAATTSYVQALRAAARDGVDVRLLVPSGTDIPLLRPLSKAGYRPLLEAGVRVFEWKGTMLHAKTAVADGHWGRVGSTNLNLASWLSNCELDAIVENESFAREMQGMYLQDLENATEIVLDIKHRVIAPGEPRHAGPVFSGGGSTGRAAAGAIRIGNAIGAAFTDRRVMEPVESRLLTSGGVVAAALAVLFAFFPRLLAYPLALLLAWIALALLYRGYKLHRQAKRKTELLKNRGRVSN
jgi:cardiolipin synthase